MSMSFLIRLTETLLVACVGGILFSWLTLPLPWMLGPLTAVMLYQAVVQRSLTWIPMIKNVGLIVLGISFGLYYTFDTLMQTLPYLPVYIVITLLLILFAITMSYMVTKWVQVDPASSIFGSIPGGLTEMVIVSQSFHANQAFVTVFQTIRLVIVLFTVPFLIIFLFSSGAESVQTQLPQGDAGAASIHYLWFILPLIGAFRFGHLLPAGIMIFPLIITIILNISPALLSSVPEILFLGAQLAIGTSLGRSIAIKDVVSAGRFSMIYAMIAILLIAFSFLTGWFMSQVTSMDMATAILSAAPGGVIEMVLTAGMVDADPAIVTSLQLTRILLILLLVPLGLKWYFTKILKIEPIKTN
ncbi:AbrB family transcriptional regulator [Salisediminibacterium beveridgei]|uniref:Ammonia monooxygenase n=1 Tax=Salisediminibacterium beveridgei TaxID=632773 RepID=A0A1D7QVF5_9BACI|nr:AbrB family transcriptional regulator [Salisediminibacterium beveridgei]AOM82993.1 hypothetical protein BBEV_1632 [Salisediminibacterium beveridgei]